MREGGILVAARQRTRLAYIATIQLRIGIVLLQCATVLFIAAAANSRAVFVVIATFCLVVIVVVIVIYARQRAHIRGNIIGGGVGEISAATARLIAGALW